MEGVDRYSNVGENQTNDNFEETRVYESADGTQWRRVDSTDEFVNIDFQNLTVDEMLKYSFRDLDLGYDFYNAYGGAKGFSIRRHLTGRNTKAANVDHTIQASGEVGGGDILEGGHNVRRCPVNIEEISDDGVDYSAYDDEQPDNSDSELETVWTGSDEELDVSDLGGDSDDYEDGDEQFDVMEG
ncbi:hypothetical protein RIF29_21022 [Crotalaria pallida]|uniref:Uncharacterized protein n=1 Tax=Crotalaria pallida TaxID=3830 RepID=A0AAN9F3Z7_CROPI